MKRMDIEFYFKGNRYDAIIRVKQNASGREFHITVLNWELERLLYGNQVISETEGVLQANLHLENEEQTALKLIIASSLGRKLKMTCFAGNQCITSHPQTEGWENMHPISRHIPPLQ